MIQYNPHISSYLDPLRRNGLYDSSEWKALYEAQLEPCVVKRWSAKYPLTPDECIDPVLLLL